MDGVEKAGDEVHRLALGEGAHVLGGEMRFGAARGGAVEHGLVDVEAGALVAGVDEVAHVGAGAAGEVQVADAAVAEELLNAVHAVALRAVVDVGAHQVVVTGQVGVEGVAGHGDLWG